MHQMIYSLHVMFDYKGVCVFTRCVSDDVSPSSCFSIPYDIHNGIRSVTNEFHGRPMEGRPFKNFFPEECLLPFITSDIFSQYSLTMFPQSRSFDYMGSWFPVFVEFCLCFHF